MFPIRGASNLQPGTCVRLRGRLALDHYQWVEFLSRYPDPPDLFYPLQIVRIRRVPIPGRFIRRTARTLSLPTALDVEHYDSATVVSVSNLDRESSIAGFWLIDFERPSVSPEALPLAFIGGAT